MSGTLGSSSSMSGCGTLASSSSLCGCGTLASITATGTSS